MNLLDWLVLLSAVVGVAAYGAVLLTVVAA